jgi:predicted RNA methylase
MLNVRLLLEKAFRLVHRGGVRGFVAKVVKESVYRQPVDEFDKVNGTDTAGEAQLWRFKIPYASARFGAAYKAPEERRIQEALESIPRYATVVDLGCGKGRPLIVAARMGFSHVIGVEFACELADIARKNLVITSKGWVTVIEGDATEYELPDGSLCVYLYSPFGLEVMRRVAAKLEARSGETWVVYLNPYSEAGSAELFDAFMERDVEKSGLIVWRKR